MTQTEPPTTAKSRSGRGLPVEQALILEKACDEFEAAWNAGNRPRIEDIVASLPGPTWSTAVRELIGLDVYYRRRIGEEPAVSDYIDRFPHGPEWLAGVIERGDESATEQSAEPTQLLASDAPDYVLPGIGTVIAGRYKLLQVIGEGGMGTVFMTEQTQPVRRMVALKIIKAGMDSKQVLARFEAEAQALALMDHPNIATVLDAGSTASGHPFFVMELVKGVPLIQFCDDRQLSIGDRLNVFQQVCHAVQHAHQKGIIHRDLKPSNILVESHEGGPLPKVIDFGLAKALNAMPLTERSFTNFGAAVGTPLYMSPEQAEIGAQDVDTRADIYSLGVILYELLTGTTPLEKNRLALAAWDEVRRVIREEVPQIPSARLSSTEAKASIAAQRHTEPLKLRKFVRGDLDWIVMMALRKERDRRYESATAFAQDVERFLNHEPVRACPPSALYRFRKLARRNKAALMVSGLIALSLVVAVAVLLISNFRIAQEKEQKEQALQKSKENEARAKAVANLVQQMLASANPEGARGADFTVRALLNEFAMGLGEQLKGQPDVEATIRGIIGRAYRQLGLNQEAEFHLTRSLELRRADPSTDPKLLAQSLVDWAWVMTEMDGVDRSEEALQEATKLYEEWGGEPHNRLEALRVLQRVAMIRSREDEITAIEQTARQIAATVPGQQDPELADILSDQSKFRLRQGNAAGAERLAQEALDLNQQARADDHPDVAWSLIELGRSQSKQGRFGEAENQFRLARAIFLKQFGNSNNISLQMVAEELSAALRAQNKGKDADDVIRDIGHRLLASNTPRDFTTLLQWAETLRGAGVWDEALAIYLAAAKLRANASRPSRLQLALGLKIIVSGLQAQGRLKECLPVHRECAGIFEEIVAESPGASDVNYVKLEQAQHLAEFFAGVLAALGHADEAILVIRRAIGLVKELRKVNPDSDEYTRHEGWYSLLLAQRLVLDGRTTEAVEYAAVAMQIHLELIARHPNRADFANLLSQAAFALHRALSSVEPTDKFIVHFPALANYFKLNQGGDSHDYVCALRVMGRYLLKLNKWSDAEKLLRECNPIEDKNYPGGWTTFETKALLGEALLGQGKHGEAEPWLLAGYEGLNKRRNQIPVDGQVRITESLERLVQLYDAWGKPAEAAKWRAEFPPIEKGPLPRVKN